MRNHSDRQGEGQMTDGDSWRLLFCLTPAAQRLSLKKAESTTPQNSFEWILEYLNWISWISMKKITRSSVPRRCWVFQSPKSQLILFFLFLLFFCFLLLFWRQLFFVWLTNQWGDRSSQHFMVVLKKNCRWWCNVERMQMGRRAEPVLTIMHLLQGPSECEAIKPNRKQEVRWDGSVMENTESKAGR